MDLEEIDYITVHVKMHCRADISLWNEVEILAAYCMLPTPAVSFAEWKSKFNKLMPSHEAENENALHAFQHIQQMSPDSPIKVEIRED